MALHGFELSPQDKEWKADVKAFWGDVLSKWQGLVALTCGSAWMILYAGMGYMITASFFLFASLACFVIACFRACTGARREKEKAQAYLKARIEEDAAIPDIAGKWYRETYGVTGVSTLTQSGLKIGGNFLEGSIDHKVDGEFKPPLRSFEVSVSREDTTKGSATRKLQKVTYWLIDGKYLAYYTRDNGLGNEDSGLLYRKDNRPD